MTSPQIGLTWRHSRRRSAGGGRARAGGGTAAGGRIRRLIHETPEVNLAGVAPNATAGGGAGHLFRETGAGHLIGWQLREAFRLTRAAGHGLAQDIAQDSFLFMM